jgi:hypothetical protein
MIVARRSNRPRHKQSDNQIHRARVLEIRIHLPPAVSHANLVLSRPTTRRGTSWNAEAAVGLRMAGLALALAPRSSVRVELDHTRPPSEGYNARRAAVAASEVT